MCVRRATLPTIIFRNFNTHVPTHHPYLPDTRLTSSIPAHLSLRGSPLGHLLCVAGRVDSRQGYPICIIGSYFSVLKVHLSSAEQSVCSAMRIVLVILIPRCGVLGGVSREKGRILGRRTGPDQRSLIAAVLILRCVSRAPLRPLSSLTAIHFNAYMRPHTPPYFAGKEILGLRYSRSLLAQALFGKQA